MAKQTQQMPLVMEIESITALTSEQLEKINQYIELDTLLDVQFKDANGEVFIPVAYTPEVVGDDSTTPATITVINAMYSAPEYFFKFFRITVFPVCSFHLHYTIFPRPCRIKIRFFATIVKSENNMQFMLPNRHSPASNG